jgi:hypothetical protein
MEGLIVQPIKDDDFKLPTTQGIEHFVHFVPGGNILDLKEKYAVSHHKNLEYAVFSFRGFANRAFGSVTLYFKGVNSNYTRANKTLAFFPAHLLAVNFKTSARYLRKSFPLYLNIEKSLHMLTSEPSNAIFKADSFPYISHDTYLQLTSYSFDMHSFIIGASGSGKSKLISLFVDRLHSTTLKMNYRVVVIDPHAALADDFVNITNQRVITFGMADGADLFPGAETDLTAATELTSTLFKSVLADQFNARLDHLLRYSLFVLMTAQTMTLENLKRFLTDIEYRQQVVSHVVGYVPPNVTKFFGTDFNELRTQYYETTILPLVSMVDEMQLQPSLVGESETSLARTIQENFLTVFSLNKVTMGEKVVKTIAGLLIQQIFLLAQARAFNEKVILIIDEVSVVQNPALAQILAESRKFNLTVVLTQQYFGQVDKDLRDAIFSNVYNYYAFKVSEEDARALEGNLNMDLPEETVESEHAKGVSQSDLKIKIMTELHPRECLVRVLTNGQVAPCIKASTVDAPERNNNHQIGLVKVKQILPKKFIENNSIQPKEITFSKEFMEKILQAETNGQPNIELYQLPHRDYGSLNDILTLHSSSRQRVNKRKDT